MKKLLLSLLLGIGLLGSGAVLAEPASSAPVAVTASAPASAQTKSEAKSEQPDSATSTTAATATSATAAVAASATSAPVPNKGDTAWMMVSTLLVILMTVPGLALFYGGLVRSKNMLSILMQVLGVWAAEEFAQTSGVTIVKLSQSGQAV
jgi:Amt family ammonium transporter